MGSVTPNTDSVSPGEHPDEVRKDELRDALNADLRDSLPPMSLAVGVLFVILALSHAIVLSGRVAQIMTTVAALTAVLSLISFWALRRRSLPCRWAHPAASLMALVILANTLLHLYLASDPLQTTNVILLVVGVGFVLFSTPWWLLVVGVTLLGWQAVASLSSPQPAWQHFGFSLISSVVVSLLVHLVRLRTYRRLEGLRLRDERRQVRLESMLHTKEQMQRALETSADIGQRLTSILDLESLLYQVTALIQERYGYDYVGIFLLDEAGEYAVAQAGTGIAGRVLCERGFRLKVGEEGIVGWVAQHRRAAGVSDVAHDPRYVMVEEIPNTRSELALPLEVAGEVLGVLDVQCSQAVAFHEDDVRVLQSLAGQVAIAVQNASMYEIERKGRLFAEKLYDVGRALSRTLHLPEVLNLILRQIEDIVPYDRGSILLQSGEELVVVAARGFPEVAHPLELRVPIKDDDVFQDISHTQRPLLIPDVQRRPDWQYVEDLPPARSWLGVPLIVADRVIGMLSLARERPDPYTAEEVTLSAAFASQAAVALENARLYDNMTRVNLRLEETVQELRARTDDLRIAYHQLERLDRTKADFISVASHELRTPLTVLSGYSQILMDDPLIKESEYHHQLVVGMDSGTARLHSIVDSMLDMAKIDSRVLQLNPERVALPMLLQSIHLSLEHIYRQRNVALTIEDMEDLPMIEVDTEAIRKVFYHLMVNAVKYTPDGGAVTLSGRALPHGYPEFPNGGVEVVVSDTGIGVDPSVKELIFAKFYQTGEVSLHSTGVTKFRGGGPGLGLAIARGIIEAHGGKIWVESPGYDEETCPGSDFHVILPLTARSFLNENNGGDRPPTLPDQRQGV